MSWGKKRRESGFTLIEMMVVLLITGILVVVAVPAYEKTMMKSRRSDAHATLLQVQLEQESWRTKNTTYGATSDVWSSAVSVDGYYDIAVSGNTSTAYTVTATPVSGGLQADDTDCASIVLDQDGPDIDTDAKKKCWNRK